MTKIKVKLLNSNCKLEITKKGDWIDMRAAETISLLAPQVGARYSVKGEKRIKAQDEDKDETIVRLRDVKFDRKLIPLGVAIQLPKGYEAIVLPRSSTPNEDSKGKGIISANSEGVIDNIYCGDNDQWFFNAIAIRHTTIEEGDRICQFRIQLSQKATKWQKIKWLFSSGVKIEYVTKLGNKDRGGFGSSGIK